MPALESIDLRAADSGDIPRVFAWRNDPWIVALSSSQREVTWEEHRAWFEAALQDPTRLILIVEKEREPIGLVRFDNLGTSCVITVYLLAGFTGQGFGLEAIRRGSDRAFSRWPEVREVVACVREENAPGRSVFAKAGFVPQAPDHRCPAGHAMFILHRPHE